MNAIGLVLLSALAATPSSTSPATDRRTLTVSGTAEVSVTPDICYMSFVVESRDRSATQAYRANNGQFKTMSAAIEAVGIDGKDLQTAQFSISPEYHQDTRSNKDVFDDYLVTNNLYVKVRDLNKVSEVLDAGVNGGATEVSGVQFAVENPKKYLADARAGAIRAAREKAETLAVVAGVKLGVPVSISEVEPGVVPDNNPGWTNVRGGRYSDVGSMSGMESAALEPGEMKVSYMVYVTYEIE